MSPEEALERMRIKQEQMAKEAEAMVERTRRLQDLHHCFESGHRWIVEDASAAIQTQIDFLQVQCSHCNAYFTVSRTNHSSAVISSLCINHDNKGMTVEHFLNGGEEE